MKAVKVRLAAFLFIIVSLLMVPASAFAETRMTGEEFLASAQDGVITLNDDVVLTSTVTVKTDLMVKLNDHMLSRDTSDVQSLKVLMIDVKEGTLAIEGPGKVTGGEFGDVDIFCPAGVIDVSGSAGLTISGGAEVYGGKIASNETIGDFRAVSFVSSGLLNIKDSKVVGLFYGNRDSAAAVYAGGQAEVSISSSTLIGGSSKSQSGGIALELRTKNAKPAHIENSSLIGGSAEMNREGGDALYISTDASARVVGGSLTGGQGNSGGEGVNVSGNVDLDGVKVSGGASIKSTPGVGVYCTSPAKNVVIKNCQIAGGSPVEGSVTNSAGRGMEIYGPVVLTVENSTIMGGNNNRQGGDIIGGNAVWFYDEDSVGAEIAFNNVILGVGNEAAGDAVIWGNVDAPAGSGKKNFANIVVGGELTVADGTLKNTTITPAEGGFEFVVMGDSVVEVGKDDLTVESAAIVESGGDTVYFSSAAEALDNASSGSKVTITKVGDDEVLPAPPVGVEVKNATDGSIVVGGKPVGPGETAGNYVAMVGERGYVSLTDAVAAAKIGGTIELLASVTVDTWQQVWGAKGLTINGNKHTLTINKVDSGSNGDYLFFGAEDLKVSDLSVVFKTNGNGFSLSSGELKSVTMVGGPNSKYAVFVDAAAQRGKVAIDGCSFTGFSGAAIYSQPGTDGAKTSDLVVNNTAIKDCGMAMCSYAQNTTFTNNTVTGGSEVSFAGAEEDPTRKNTYTVTGNKFDSAGKIWFSGANLDVVDFEGNKVLGSTVVSTEDSASGKLDVSKNYWGGGKPGDQQIGGDENVVTGEDTYYEKETMRPEDLNTYVPPVVTKTYKVNVEASEHGKVTADVDKAASGKTVTLTAAADKGFELTKLSVTDASGKDVAVTKGKGSTYTFIMPAADVTVTALFGCDGGALCPSKDFADVDPSEWYHAAIDWAVANDVLNGIGDTGRMDPLGKLTRAQMAAILYNVEGSPAVDVAAGNKFSDFDSSAWYAKAVAWTATKDLFQGYGTTGVFGANDVLTREQAAAVLMRWSAMNGRDVTARADLSAYPDVASMSVWAKDCMSWAVAEGMINGVPTSDGILELKAAGTATRAQAASLMMNLVDE